MSKITLNETATEDRWILLRRPLGPWVGELKKVWRNAKRGDKQQLCVFDPNDVTFVEAPVVKLGPASPHEINLSGSQVVVGFLSALSTIGLLLWAFLKLWLFEP